MIFAFIIFFAPEFGGFFLEADNFVPADPLVTPEHIVPVWYFTPFYAMLRAVPDKFFGVVTMGAAIFVLFFLPWLDRSPVKSLRYKDRKSTRLNSSHVAISYADLCFTINTIMS